MWRRACPLLTFAFAAGLVITRRRLSEAQAELDHLRAVARTPAAGAAAEPVAAKPETTGHGAATTGAVQASEVATSTAELSSEWEQAVPPMDS
jgi:hypothetical protein